CYFVTGVVPLFVASDAGTMIFVETDPTNTECAMPVNNPPTAFNLMAPANHDTLWIDPNDLGGATMFAWTPSSDPDGAPIEYSIEWNYQELTLVHTLDTTGLAVFVQNVDIFDDIVNGGLAGVTIEWNVSASDGLGETVATNGPFMMHVEALLGVGDEALIPDVFALHQNYPNPFNPTTRIEYDIPEISNVQITIYNVMGQKVRTLVNAEHSPGYHSVLWNGTNEFGSPVSSGMYFYQIKANNFNKVKKLVLMK
ncbi:MAG: T9SS type A sorting domain-containing protein, partial [Candidatus Marinimicrobia bacterium]|nr:T9SS type A sorting domain-containing protein [Candidatus Neomarinimicrobiota bacterium]